MLASKPHAESASLSSSIPARAAAPPRGRRWLGAGIALAVFCGVAWGLYPLPDAAARLRAIPLAAGDFVGTDIPLTPKEREVLGRVNVVHRAYRDGHHEIFTTAIDGTRDRHAVHDPRYCFQGAGWRILEERPLALPGGTARWVRAANGPRTVEALFWFSDGAGRHASPLRYWAQTTARRMTLGHSGAEPVLVVLQSFGERPPDWATFAPDYLRALGL